MSFKFFIPLRIGPLSAAYIELFVHVIRTSRVTYHFQASLLHNDFPRQHYHHAVELACARISMNSSMNSQIEVGRFPRLGLLRILAE